MSSSDREGRVPVRMTSEEYPIIISFSTAAKMATTGQKWETVGKVNKKHKANGSAGSKAQKRLLKENMPTLEVSAPLKESPTIYDAFLEKTPKPEKPAKDHVKPTSNGDTHKKPSQQRKKTGGEKKKEQASLEEAAKKLEASDFETELAKDKAIFPDNPSVWLKDLASMLNLKLDNVAEPDPMFDKKPKDYPLCTVPKPVQTLLRKTLHQCSVRVLELFLEHCIQSMINDMGKGIPTFGSRIFIQLLALDKPDLVLSGLPKYLEMVRQNQNRPLRCLSIMWAVGQAGNKHLTNGLKVWLEFMLPVLSIRALSSAAVHYLEVLFKSHENLKPGFNMISFRNFFPILDLIFASHPNMPTALQKKLMSLYPKVKAISFGKEPENNLRNFFPCFLTRLGPNSNKALKAELLSSLIECLIVDKQCFSVWRQMYTKHLDQSGVLLHHMVETWDSLQHRIERKLLSETIRAFSITNEELSSRGRSGGEGYRTCVSSCKELLVKMSSLRFPWRFLILLVLAIITGIVSYDMYTSRGFKNSRIAKFLQDAGLLVFLEQVWNRIQLYSARAMSWLCENVPYYYAKACEFVGPYLQLVWEKMYDAGVYIAESTKPQRDWLALKITELFDWVQSKVPWLTTTLSQYALLVWDYSAYLTLLVWTHVVQWTQATGTWFQENIFTGSLSGENIYKTVSSSMATVQTYSSWVVQWCTQLVSSKSN